MKPWDLPKYLFLFFFLLGPLLWLSGVTSNPSNIESSRRYNETVKLSPISELEQHLTKSSADIPIGSFLATYYRRPDSNKTAIYKETVDKAVINYPYANFQNIDSEEFEGYWVGNFDFDQEEVQSFHISQGHSKTRILVNRRVVYEGDDSTVIPVKFNAGLNRIEIQHVNNWHTVGFSVKLFPQGIYDETPQANPSQSSTIWYVGVYKSLNRNGDVTLHLKSSSTPIHLYLSSYEPVNWNIEQAAGSKLAGVYFNSSSPGTTVEFSDKVAPVKDISDSGLPNIYTLDSECYSDRNFVHCDPPLYLGDVLKESISSLTGGFPASGFAGRYDADNLEVPSIFLTERKYDELHQKSEKLEKKYLKKIKD